MKLTKAQTQSLLDTLKKRFETNPTRHPGIAWPDVQQRLEAHPKKLWSLHQMEETGGRLDVVYFDKKNNEHTFYHCAREIPQGRRSHCYNQESLDARKQNKPQNAATQVAKNMGIELLTEQEYHQLQQLESFDIKTSNWVHPPPNPSKT